jgi:hypothetical protein
MDSLGKVSRGIFVLSNRKPEPDGSDLNGIESHEPTGKGQPGYVNDVSIWNNWACFGTDSIDSLAID